ncbi:thiamine pyrophosphate-binding protein [Sphingopyxis lindanitolerans]|nr:thiamine pyrophosphate-binding protein [Sphingopyxis lindanitolerans]
MSIDMISGGEAMAAECARQAVRTVFALSGAAHAQLLQALAKNGVRVVSTRHETGTVCAADGYARIARKPGLALIKEEQGLANAVTGILTAQKAGTPVVILVGCRPASATEVHHEGEDDPLAMVRPMAKWVHMAPNPERMAAFLAEAFHQASTGRPGVAILGIRQEFGRAMVSAAAPHPMSAPASPPAPEATAIAAAAAALCHAQRPMILAGGGAYRADAGPALRRLAARLGAPVLGHAQGRGLVPEDDMLGFGWPLAQVAAREADVVLCVGMRLGQRFNHGLAPRFSPDALFIQIDTVAEEFGRGRPIDIPIVADARLGTEALCEALGDGKPRDAGWVRHAMAARLARLAELEAEGNGPIHPLTLCRRLMDRWPEDAIYVGDGADIQNWMLGTLRLPRGGAFIDHYPFGSMGVGTPLALGASAAAREVAELTDAPPRPVILVTGDGSFGFYCAELNSAKLADLQLAVVVSNDGAWGTEKHGHIKLFNDSYNCELGQADYHLIAHAFDCGGERVDESGDIAGAIDRMLAAKLPYVLNVLTDPMAGAARKTDPRVVTVAFEDIVQPDGSSSSAVL